MSESDRLRREIALTTGKSSGRSVLIGRGLTNENRVVGQCQLVVRCSRHDTPIRGASCFSRRLGDGTALASAATVLAATNCSRRLP